MMSPRIVSILMILGGGALLLIFWAASIGFVYWDVYRRNLPWRQQIAWIAVVALLPLLGFFAYVFYRFVYSSKQKPGTFQSPLKKRETQPLRTHPKQVYLPTIAIETQPEPAGAGVNPFPQAGPATPRMRPAYFLTVSSGPVAGQQFTFDQLPVTIGRGLESTIRLDDRAISRRHAEVYQRDGWLFIRDLDSTHGTQVNGVWVSEQRLEPGDEIQVGNSALVFGIREGQR